MYLSFKIKCNIIVWEINILTSLIVLKLTFCALNISDFGELNRYIYPDGQKRCAIVQIIKSETLSILKHWNKTNVHFTAFVYLLNILRFDMHGDYSYCK